MRRKRRNHGNAFKAKVALAAVRGDRTVAALADQFQIHPGEIPSPIQIQTWKTQLTQNAEDVFEKGPSRKQDEEEGQIKELHAKIGKLDELYIERPTRGSRTMKDALEDRVFCGSPIHTKHD